MVVIILICYKWHRWTVQLWDGVYGQNTQFLGLPTGLRQEGYLAVKLFASIKSCKMSNNVMLYKRVISKRHDVIPGREKVRCGPIQITIQWPHQICKLCVSSWNTGTMHGRVSEVVEAIGHRQINIRCVQESCWKGCSARLISAKTFIYKFIRSWDNSGFGGVHVLLNENWIDKVISVVRLNHQIMCIHILVGKLIINIFSVYAPQTGLSVVEKFYSALLSTISITSPDAYLLVCGDFNGHAEEASEGFNGVPWWT